MGIPPTGKSISMNVIDILGITEGTIVAHWGIMDRMAMMQQLGVIPVPGEGGE
jgi:predicted ester cyclase